MGAFTGFLKELKGQGKVSKVGVRLRQRPLRHRDALGLTATLKEPGSRSSTPRAIARRQGPLARPQGIQGGRRRRLLGLTIPGQHPAASQAKEVDFNPPSISPPWHCFPSTATASRAPRGVGDCRLEPEMKYPGAREYYEAHVKKHQKEPDRWASPSPTARCRSWTLPWVRWARPEEDKEMLDATESRRWPAHQVPPRASTSPTPAWWASGRGRVRDHLAQGAGDRARHFIPEAAWA